MEDELAIGIDLGTTYSCVAVCKNGKVEIIPNECGNRITPSYVSFSEAKRLIGDEAKDQAAVNPENTVFDVKRIIGREFVDKNVQADMKHWPFEVIDSDSLPKIKVMFKKEEKIFFPEEISAMLLSKMKELAELHTEKRIINAVITVPAYFNDSQRQATRDAGKIAGLNVIRLVNEPTAAAIAYGLQNRNIVARNILIYDLGGGTFDVSILSIKDQKIHVKAVGGNAHLGGEDFDSNMMTYMVNEIKNTKNIDIETNRGAMRRLRNACEKGKKILSTLKETKIEIVNVVEDVNYETVFSRSMFEELNATLFQLTVDTVAKCLQEAGVGKSEIDDIVLVGGSTRIPKIREILKAFFDNRELNATINPDEAVAYGAAILAANHQGSKCKEIQEIQLFDVIPLSLGLDLSDDRTDVLIPRNSTIPIEKKKTFYTSFYNQKEVAIPVYEGEHRLSQNNHFLGQFGVTGYPPKSKGYNEFEVTFKIDNDGILKVSAVEKNSATGDSMTIYCDKGRLSKEEIDCKIAEAEYFKNEENRVKGLTNIRNSIIAYCNETKSKLKKKPYDKQLSPTIKSLIFEKCDETLEWVNTTLSNDLNEFMREKNDLEKFCKNLLKR